MPANPETPTADSCPSWCEGFFCTNRELPPDRMHRSSVAEVAGVMRSRWLDAENGRVVRSAEPITLNVLATQYAGERRVWIVISTEDRALEISVETARELHAELGELLRRFRA